jgi:BirA family biotin operon repressor/biotin-[acetyl-CoA-carboxylase] ligase
VAGVALADALEALGVPAGVKWPNDLYLGDRKAAGILAEMSSDPDRVRHVVIGVGINVNMAADEFPPEISAKATSLRIRAGRPFSRIEVLARFLDSFAGRYAEFLSGGFAAILGEWDRRDYLRGRRVLLRTGRAEGWGVAEGIDAEGALRFRPDGAARTEAVRSGEILDIGR